MFLYANSGHQQYISLYLSCEPTASEIEKGAMERGASSSNQMASKGAVAGGNGKSTDGKGEQRVPWRREGKFKFTFEVRACSLTTSADESTGQVTRQQDDVQADGSVGPWLL